MKTKINKTSIATYFLIFVLFHIFFLYLYTPPNNIIFWDVDSRSNIDEIAQIIKPSSLYDFIFDSAYGGYVPYGRVYQFVTAVFLAPFSLITNFSIPVLIFFVHLSIFFLGYVILLESVFGKNPLKYLVLPNLLIVCIMSKAFIKTTSVEIFIFSLIVFYIFKSKNKHKEKIIYFIFGVLTGLKFIHAIYPVIYFFINLKKITFKKFIVYFVSGISGLIAGQPYVLIPKGFTNNFKFIFETLNYKEGYTVTYVDWLKIAYYEFNSIILFIPLALIVSNFKNIKLKNEEKFLILAPSFQIISFFFSDNLIRQHYLNLPMSAIIIFIFLMLKNKKITTTGILILYLVFNFNYFLNNSHPESIKNAGSYEGFINTFYESEEYVEMNKVNEYILNDVRTSNDKLIWWHASQYMRPYSEFHWGSTEDPENSEYYYKDIWGSKLKFSNDRCADYGGIVVLLLTENEVAEISNNLINKNFRLQKSFEKQDNGLSYFVFYNPNFSHPIGC